MAGENPTISEYIVHHLTNLTYGQLPGGYERADGSVVAEGGAWVMAHGGEEAAAMGFNAIHIDSMAWSIALGVLFCWLFRRVAKKAEAGVPSGFVNLAEMIVEFVDNTVRDTFHGQNKMVAPLALTIFVWVFMHSAALIGCRHRSGRRRGIGSTPFGGGDYSRAAAGGSSITSCAASPTSRQSQRAHHELRVQSEGRRAPGTRRHPDRRRD